jgi:hypothetical protein
LFRETGGWSDDCRVEVGSYTITVIEDDEHRDQAVVDASKEAK